MTAPLWTDKRGLSLLKTTSEDYLFLQVEEQVMPLMRPFIELAETQAIWQPAAKPHGGWLIPTTMFPRINHFLEEFHHILPSGSTEFVNTRNARAIEQLFTEGQVTYVTPSAGQRAGERIQVKDQGRIVIVPQLFDMVEFAPGVDLYASESVYETKTEGRATIHWISWYTLRLLCLLKGDVSVATLDAAEALLYKGVDPTPERRFSSGWDELSEDLEWERFQYSAEVLNLEYRYIQNRGGDIKRGDILKHRYMRADGNTFVAISDGTTFIELWNVNGPAEGVPPEFKCPTPFPVMYWAGIIVYGNSVWPNFDELADTMEYDSDPPKPTRELVDIDAINFHKLANLQSYAALRFVFEGATYLIYFYSATPKAFTFERILELINDPRYYYTAIDETTMATWVPKYPGWET